MIRNFDYKDITLNDTENNKHLIFICSGDEKKVLVNKKEFWKPIKEHENMYSISNFGGVRNLKTGKKLNPYIHRCGYLRVRLYKENTKKTFYVHRLVAETFIPNPNNKPQVNHKNGIKTDNRAENLEWCDNSQNQLHAYRNNLRKKYYGVNHKNSVSVLQCDLKGNVIKEWACIREAGEKTNTNKTAISNCCRNICKTAGGYIWRYKVEVLVEKE